jgi:glycosyltransferase involved in cell wall biosynthesis
MNIAAQLSSYNHIDELKNNFIYQCLTALAKNDSSVQILFITDKDFVSPHEKTENIRFLPASHSNKQIVYRLYWNMYTLPKIISSFGTDVFFSDRTFPEKKIKAKKILWINNLSELNNLKKNILLADLIVCPNHHLCEKTEETFQLSNAKLAVMSPGMDAGILPVGFEEKEKIKTQYTSGAEYFYFDGISATLDMIKKTLQAFSLFKKWQKSSMKMMISTDLKKQKGFLEMLKNYKYREDVVYVNPAELDNIELIRTSSYAAVFFPEKISLESRMMHCFAGQTPVILPDNEFYRSSFGSAVLYSKDSVEAIAENLILLYKDESVRNNLIAGASELSAGLSWQKAAVELAKRAKELM